MALSEANRRASVDPAGEFPFAVDDYLLHLLAAIHQFRDSTLDAILRPVGLNVSRYRVLGVLNRFGACTMQELTAFTALDRTTLTRIADHLVADGFAERGDSPKDRRHVILVLTEEGRATHRNALGLVFDLNTRLMAGVPEGEARETARVLQRIVGNLAPNATARDSIIHYSREALDRTNGRKP